jgi:hypothetical protein
MSLLLLAAKFQKLTPQNAFAFDLDKSWSGHFLFLRAWGYSAALR